MTLTPDQAAAFDAALGIDTWDDFDTEQILIRRHGDVSGTILEVLMQRRAALMQGPAVFNVAGEYSQDQTANLTELDKRIDELGGSAGPLRVIPPPRRHHR